MRTAEELGRETQLEYRQLSLAGEAFSVCTLYPLREKPQALPWLLLHGAGHEAGVWQEVAVRLAACGAVVHCPDLPGHGRSRAPALDSIAALADWAQRLLDALALPRVQLAGHSLGSLIALELASREQERCASLALLGSSLPMPVAAFLFDSLRNEPERARQLINQFSFAREPAVDAPGRQLLAAGLARLQACPAAVLEAGLRACDGWAGGDAALTACAAPVLLLSAADDRMTPPAAAAAMAAVLAAREHPHHSLCLADSGHNMMLEQPAAVASALLAQGV